jgi:hypothetical protein
MTRRPKRSVQSTEKEVPHAEEFRGWLRRRGMSDRVINDTVSRTKRASGLISLQGPPEDNAIGSALRQNHSYVGLSIFVRSQLKRAVLLYRTFLRFRRNAGQ